MKLTLRQSQILKDLKFPLLWLPIFTFFANFIIYVLYPGNKINMGQEFIFIVIISGVGSLLTTLSYLVIPLIIRFLILKRPMREQSFKTYIAAIAIGIFVKGTIFASGIIESRSASIPILNIIAIGYVLTAGFKMQQFIYREPGSEKLDSSEIKT